MPSRSHSNPSRGPQPGPRSAFRRALRREATLLGQVLRNRRLHPVTALTAGYLLLWLAALPYGPGRTVWELPHEPRLTLGHALTLTAATAMSGGAVVLALRAWRSGAQHRWRSLAGALECGFGTLLLIYIMLVLNSTLPAPGWLMGARTGRVAYLGLPLLYRGGALGLAPHLSRRPSRLLLWMSLATLLLSLAAMVRYPYAYIDGEFFGPAPPLEALGLGVLLAGAVALTWWCGLRARLTGELTPAGDRAA